MNTEKNESASLMIEIIKWYIIAILSIQGVLLGIVVAKLAPIFDQYVYPNIEKKELSALLLIELIMISLLSIACFYLYKMAKKVLIKYKVQFVYQVCSLFTFRAVPSFWQVMQSLSAIAFHFIILF